MAHVDYFLKIDGIEGESTDAKHKGEIELEGWSWGQQQSGKTYGGTGLTGKVSIHDFSFVMKANKASPKLMGACTRNEPLKKAVLVCRKAGKEQQEYLKFTISDAFVSSYQIACSPTSVVPTDNFNLNFAKIEVEYKEQKADGTLGGVVKYAFDLGAFK